MRQKVHRPRHGRRVGALLFHQEQPQQGSTVRQKGENSRRAHVQERGGQDRRQVRRVFQVRHQRVAGRVQEDQPSEGQRDQSEMGFRLVRRSARLYIIGGTSAFVRFVIILILIH